MNDPKNPYAPPTTRVADQEARPEPTDSGTFIPNGRVRPAGAGARWIGDAWRLLKARPGQWALALLLMFVAWIVLSMIPLVGFFMQLAVPFAIAGIALVADEQRRTGSFEVGTLLGGFKQQAGRLLAVGGLMMAAYIVIGIFVAVAIGIDFIRMAGAGSPDFSILFSLKNLLVILICIALMLPVGMAVYLAPQLIVLHNVPAVEAMKMSLFGTLKNILAGLVFAIVSLALVLVSMIPLFLGLLISIPILVITNYTVYRDIFVEEND